MKAASKSIMDAINRFFPLRYMQHNEDQKDDTKINNLNLKNDATEEIIDLNGPNSIIITSLKEKWETLKGKSSHDCVRIFLTCTRKWQFFGSTLFEVKVNNTIVSVYSKLQSNYHNHLVNFINS